MEKPLDENSLNAEEPSCINTKIKDHPLAFTIEFDDQKFDESRKSKVRERLTAFTLKHKRNPSLPDFREVKNSQSFEEKSSFPEQLVVIHKKPEKTVKNLETQWKSSALKAVKNLELKTPFLLKNTLGGKNNLNSKSLKIERRYSLDGTENSKVHDRNKSEELENKSDTVSEAGTYTVDKDELKDGSEKEDANKVREKTTEGEEENEQYLNKLKENYRNNWIKDWVRDVEEQNNLNPTSGFKSKNFAHSNGFSKIPSPSNTLTRKPRPGLLKPGDGAKFHKRSSSLSAKDHNENRGSESSLDTESYLKTTESVMASMQSRMKSVFAGVDKKDFSYKERPHPPSTASNTDSSSENDGKAFKKPLGNPFTSARLNRAFSLRRAKADPEKTKPPTNNNNNNNSNNNLEGNAKTTMKPSTPKPRSSAPFSRLECGRFSMRSTVSNVRANATSQTPKKEVKKPSGGNRSSSSLSSREVEFQNWRRRKSFDPMKAAAEGRKKEMAKKAAAMTNSMNAGSRTRSSAGNPVLRSASFHSTVQVLGGGDDDDDDENEFQDQTSADEPEESTASSYLSNPHSRINNSPFMMRKPAHKTPVFSSRNSLVSETHSSPSRGLRSNDLENLVLSAIGDASYKLKLKSCKLLKKLNYLYDSDDERSLRVKYEIAVLERGNTSAKNSPVHQTTSRDLSAILKNLKGVENVFNLLENVLFDDTLEITVMSGVK